LALGEAREKLGDSAGAAAAFRAALRADRRDALGAGPRLALLEGRGLAALPPAYVARLFDDYAPRFDRHLTQTLGYRGPELIVAALDAVAPGRRFGLAYDLGCGSGLAARALRARIDRLVGVDLSEGMVKQARASGVYDELAVGDLVAFLAGREAGGADLAVAADALVYVGDLQPIFRAAARATAAGGLIVLTLETLFGGEGFALAPSMRFRHAPAYVERTAQAAGFKILSIEARSTRIEHDTPVPGLVVTLASRGTVY